MGKRLIGGAALIVAIILLIHMFTYEDPIVRQQNQWWRARHLQILIQSIKDEQLALKWNALIIRQRNATDHDIVETAAQQQLAGS